MPPHSFGMWGNHRPSRLASSRSSRMVVRYSRRWVTRPSSSNPLTRGTTVSWMNVRTRERISSCSGARVKSIAMGVPPWASVEADHVSVVVDVDVLCGRVSGEARHGAHVAAQQVDEAGTHIGASLAHGKAPAARGPEQRGVLRDR